MTFVCCDLFVWGKYLVCWGEKEQKGVLWGRMITEKEREENIWRKKFFHGGEGKYLEKENICSMEENDNREGIGGKYLKNNIFSTEEKKNWEWKYLEKENEWWRQPSNQLVEYNEISLFNYSSIKQRFFTSYRYFVSSFSLMLSMFLLLFILFLC